MDHVSERSQTRQLDETERTRKNSTERKRERERELLILNVFNKHKCLSRLVASVVTTSALGERTASLLIRLPEAYPLLSSTDASAIDPPENGRRKEAEAFLGDVIFA